ncbi:MAG: hypothetical protein ACRD2N_17215 [Vicinamibacterales bacterium]
MAAAEPAPETLSLTVARLDQLIALFNKRGMDLPAGLFDRTTQFLLNGAAYETLLGRSSADPLLLMLARGPAGYRFIVKAVQHSVPDAHVQRGEIVWSDKPAICQGEVWLAGHLRGSGEALNAVIGFELWLAPAGCVHQVAVTLDAQTLDKLREARLKP